MISALFSALATGAILTAGIITYRELDELSNTRHLEALDRLFDEFRFRMPATTGPAASTSTKTPSLRTADLPPDTQVAMIHTELAGSRGFLSTQQLDSREGHDAVDEPDGCQSLERGLALCAPRADAAQ